MSSLYEELGVAPDASEDEINAAYKAAAKVHHPDKGGDPERFNAIGRAIAVLRNPVQRAKYDETGEFADGPDNTDAEAKGNLVGAFMRAVLHSEDLAHKDIVALATQDLRQQVGEGRKAQAELKQQAKKLRAAIKRLGHKGRGKNFLAAELNNHLERLNNGIAEMGRKIATFDKAIALAKDFNWEVDAEEFSGAAWVQPSIRLNPFGATSGTATF